MKRFILLTFLAFTIAGSALADVFNLSPYVDAGSEHSNNYRSTSVAIPLNISYSDTVRVLGADILQAFVDLDSTDTEGVSIKLQATNTLSKGFVTLDSSGDSITVTSQTGITYPYAAGYQFYRLRVSCLGDTAWGTVGFRAGGNWYAR